MSQALLNYRDIRQATLKICDPLELEDFGVQPYDYVSPPKWHLAHTTWFFEKFILKKELSEYREFSQNFAYLFNSYYQGVGDFWPQSRRGCLSRPTLKEVFSYREYVDYHLEKALGEVFPQDHFLLQLGLHHEQQHQELLFMDIKAILSENPERPLYSQESAWQFPKKQGEWLSFAGGLTEIGFEEEGFCYDNEKPRHQVFQQPFALYSDFVTNEEYLEFILDRGYQNPSLWLSAGFDWVQKNAISCPRYWFKREDSFWEYSLDGAGEIILDRPVQHISFYEADAFSRWKGKRLPTESEYEVLLARGPHFKNTLWAWTSSPYRPYPGYRPFSGEVGEYNGKFMCNQFVLKGGCYMTPQNHLRASYRNFYRPQDRWLFSGIRLAKDL